MPLYKLLNEMPYDEYIGWASYFEMRPPGWRDDDRTAKLLQAQGVKEKPWKLFNSLDVIYNGIRVVNEEGMDMTSIKASPIFQKMLTARGGDKLDI